MTNLFTNLSNRKLKYVCALVVFVCVGVGNVWAVDPPTLSNLSFPTPLVQENFNNVSTTSTTSRISDIGTSQTNYGEINSLYNNDTGGNNTIAVASSGNNMTSNYFSLTQGTTKQLIAQITGKSFSQSGAWRITIEKSSTYYFGLYNTASSSSSFAYGQVSAFLRNVDGAISIQDGTSKSNWTSVGSSTNNTIDICVIYNLTNQAVTYGGSISLGSMKAHVYIDGTCVNTAGTPTAFTLRNNATVTAFRITTNASGTHAYVDDIKVYSSLPTAAASCTGDADMSSSAASLKGSFSLSSVGVTVTGMSAGSNCTWSEAGFVWSPSSNTTPTVGGTNCDKETPILTSGNATTCDGTLTGSFSTGNTYYYRAYGKNNYGSATYQYSAVQSFTPCSITFNLNGHGSSTPSTQYVNSGSKASDPSYSESVSGWVFGGWFREAECTNEWTFGTDVVSKDTTLYAKWTQKCSTPTFSPAAGTHTGTQSVTISCAAPSNATIRYTTDGTTPTKSVGTVYSEAISVSATTTIKAIAYKDGCLDSEVAEGTFTIKCATPTFSVAEGTKHGAQSVELSCATADAKIYYTTDNTTPTNLSTEYTGTAIDVSTSKTIKAIAIKSGLNNSEVASAAYTIQYQVTWTVNGDDDDITPTWVNCGTKPTLPDAPDACDATSTTFIGWTQTRWDDKIAQSAIDDKTTDATKVHTSNSTMPNVEGNVTYHAVWAKGSSSPSNEWGLVKSTSSLSNGDKVIFAHVGSGSAYLMSKDTVTEAGYEYRKYTTSTFSISTEKITITSVATDKTDKTKPHALTVGKSGDYWTFYDGLNSGYINCGGTALIDKNLLCYQAILTDAGKWALSINSTTGEASVTSQTSETDRNLLKRNGTTNTGIFSCYKSTSNDVYNPYIFKNLSTTSYSDYMTTCCDYHVTVNDPSITDAASSGSTITFDKTHPATCNGGATVQATLTLAAGYQASALSFTRSDDDDVSVSPAISTPITSTTVYTLTFGNEDNITLSTSATIQAKPVSSWTWTYGGEAIPNPVNLYVGEKARFDVEYTPSDVILSKKTYTRTKVDAYINWYGGDLQPTYFYCSGRASTGENTTPVTITHADGPETTIYVKVKALPTVTFVDLIHNKTDFTNSGDGWTAGTGVLSSTVSTGVVSHAKKTPTHTDVSAPVGGNACETGHLHLMGWIRSDYSKVADYMNGTGEAPTKSELENAGTGYWFEPDADINVETYNGKTFYAVWAVEE